MQKDQTLFIHANATERIVVFNKIHRVIAKIIQPGNIGILNPFIQEVVAHFPIYAAPISLVADQVHSSDGIPFSVEWMMVYGVDPNQIEKMNDSQEAANLVIIMAHEATSILRTRGEEYMRYALGKYNARALCGLLDREMLGEMIRDRLTIRLRAMGVIVYRFTISTVIAPRSFQEVIVEEKVAKIRARSRCAAMRIYGQLELHEQQLMLAQDYAAALLQHGFPSIMQTPALMPTITQSRIHQKQIAPTN